jgi:predicted heme/steroid binding protein/uncharacterized membrane protein
MSDDRVFSREELKAFDGRDGRPVYVAYDGKVYDVSASKLWKTGSHMRRHASGQDLSADLAAAPHRVEVFDRVPQVGALEPETRAGAEAGHLPAPLAALLERFPFLERHPHPMTVHFPIVFLMATPVFAALALITGRESFEVTSLNTLGAGVFFTAVAMVTGVFTWWVNYMARAIKAVAIKIRVSAIMLVISATAFAWRLSEPRLLHDLQGAHVIYAALLLSLLPLVSVVGWYGATLTFPLRGADKDPK